MAYNRHDQFEPGWKKKPVLKKCTRCGKQYTPTQPRMYLCHNCLKGKVIYEPKDQHGNTEPSKDS
jgi:predicted  nucleic acid-binding Zn-ribbon protein